MDCADCRGEMAALELGGVEIDHCFACGGAWLDAGELELLLSGAAEKDRVLGSLGAEPASREKKRNCPICSAKMGKVACGPDARVCVDKCARGHGLWFDRGELEAVLGMGRFADDRVLGLLKEIFGKK